MVLFWIGSLLLLDCSPQSPDSSLMTPKSAEEIPTVDNTVIMDNLTDVTTIAFPPGLHVH